MLPGAVGKFGSRDAGIATTVIRDLPVKKEQMIVFDYHRMPAKFYS